MIPHPKTMQAVTDQRWHELQVKTHRERLAMTTHQQTPKTTHRAALRRLVVTLVRMLPLGLCWRPEIGSSPDARRAAVP